MNHPTLTAAAPPRSRALRLAVAVVVAALALGTVGTATSGVAEAAGTKLEATPNPVIIPFGQTNQAYKLSWDTGTGLPATLTVSVDNGPEFPFTNQPSSGTLIPTIDIGQTQVWRMYSKSTRAPDRVITVTTRRPDQSCLGYCIKDVQVAPHGSYADFAVIATGPLKSYVLDVHKDGQSVAGMIGLAGNQWTTTAWHLAPNTVYSFTLTVWDESGNSQVWSGLFKTLRPRVHVTIDSISVADDSDALSEGEFHWVFRVGAYWDQSFSIFNTVESGETFFPGYSKLIEPDTADLVIGLYGGEDDDEPYPFQVDACGTGIWTQPNYNPGTGSNACGEWATAWTSVPVLVDGVGESFTAPFALGVSEDVMSFLAHGTYTVTYV